MRGKKGKKSASYDEQHMEDCFHLVKNEKCICSSPKTNQWTKIKYKTFNLNPDTNETLISYFNRLQITQN